MSALHRLRALSLLLVAVLALVTAGCGDNAEEKAEPDPATAQQAPSTQAAGCRSVEAPQPKGPQNLKKPTEKLDAKKTYTATVATSCGDFSIKLDVKRAPKTSASFASLARQGFFDGLTFHRIVPGFVIQGGDPLGNGTGDAGYDVVEPPPADLKYTRGVVAMAKAGTDPPGSSSSQFYVVTGEDAGLPPEYALLGKVTEGQDVVDTIGAVETDPTTEAPVSPVVIDSVKITER